MVHLLTFIISILFCSLSVQRWSGLKIKIALVRELLIAESYLFEARTTERGKVWQQIADNPNSDHTLKFPSKKFGGF